MTFPIFDSGKILFSDGKPATSDNCCCGYYRLDYSPCCYAPEYGCRWPAAPISSLSWSGYKRGGDPTFKALEWDMVQNGASYTDQDPETGCVAFIYIPMIGTYTERYKANGGILYENTYTDFERVFSYRPDNVSPRLNDGLLKANFPHTTSPIFGLDVELDIPTELECGGPRSGSVSNSPFEEHEADFFLTARRCTYP